MITVIIPTYNGEAYIDRCMNSLLNQTIGIHNMEVIIVDDASTDTTPAIIQKYKEKYPELISIILNKIHSSIEKRESREQAIPRAKGNYIMFLDQDDWYELNALEILEKYMNDNTDLDYIEYGYYFVSEEKKTVKNVIKNGFNIHYISNEEDRNIAIENRILPGYATAWNKIYNKNYILNKKIVHNSGEKLTKYADNFFSALLVMNTKCMATLNIPLYNYYLHEDNLSKKASTIFDRCRTGIFFFEEAIARELYKRNKIAVEYMFFQIFLLKTFWKYLLQFSYIQFKELQYIHSKVRELVPEYRKNPLLARHEEMNVFFDILDKEWDEDYLEQLRIRTLEELEKKDFVKRLYLVTDFKIDK